MNRGMLSLLSFGMSFRVTPNRILSCLEGTSAASRRNLEFVTPEAVRVAAVQLEKLEYRTIQEYALEMLSHARAAVEQGAQLVVYPEYVGLLPMTLVPGWRGILRWLLEEGEAPTLEAKIRTDRLRMVAEALHDFLEEAYLDTFSTIARLQHVCVVAGTGLFWEEEKLHHRSVVFGPDGEPLGSQDRVNPVGSERWAGVASTWEVEPVPTPLGPLGVVFGPDAYYFECFQILREKQVKLVAVPSARAGAFPDLLRCRANGAGLFVANACYSTPGLDGRAGVYAPVGATPHFDGVAARATEGGSQMVCQRLNLAKEDYIPPDSVPNPAFLAGDYLHSYRYGGGMPVVVSQEFQPED